MVKSTAFGKLDGKLEETFAVQKHAVFINGENSSGINDKKTDKYEDTEDTEGGEQLNGQTG